jgi:hypothetical protein
MLFRRPSPHDVQLRPTLSSLGENVGTQRRRLRTAVTTPPAGFEERVASAGTELVLSGWVSQVAAL